MYAISLIHYEVSSPAYIIQTGQHYIGNGLEVFMNLHMHLCMVVARFLTRLIFPGILDLRK